MEIKIKPCFHSVSIDHEKIHYDQYFLGNPVKAMETFFFFLQKKDYQKSRVGTLLSQYSFGSQQQMAGIGDRGDGEKY